MDLAERIRAWLLPLLTVDERIHVDFAPQLEALVNEECTPEDVKPFVWLSRSTTDSENCLGQVGGDPDSETFDLEAIANDQATTKNLARLLHGLHGQRVLFGGIWCDAFISDQTDDYTSRTQAVEFGLYTSALSLQILRNG